MKLFFCERCGRRLPDDGVCVCQKKQSPPPPSLTEEAPSPVSAPDRRGESGRGRVNVYRMSILESIWLPIKRFFSGLFRKDG